MASEISSIPMNRLSSHTNSLMSLVWIDLNRVSTHKRNCYTHYPAVIMSAVAFQITSLSTVCSTVCSGADQRKKDNIKARVTGLCAGNSPVTGEFPAQRDSSAENVSIWWRHHDIWRKRNNGAGLNQGGLGAHRLAVIQFLVNRSQQNFAHGTTALSCAQFCANRPL